MQERRTTIRTSHRFRTQYCSSEDLLPRDGRITDLSERGVGLLVREAHRAGEMMTVGFSLPGERTTLTATGVVRWSNPPQKGRWYPIGLDWLQLEDSTKTHLQQYLAGPGAAAAASAPPAPKAAKPAPSKRKLVRAAAIVLLVLALAGAGGYWIQSLSSTNQELQTVVTQRDTVISHLVQQRGALTDELDAAKTYLAATTAEVARLDSQTQQLGDQMDQMTIQMNRVQESYTQVRDEREQLMQQVMTLEQDKSELAEQLASIRELRRAIGSAVSARQGGSLASPIVSLGGAGPVRETERPLFINSNRSYFTRGGSLPISKARRIRVLEPEAP